ncbi:hypothetical protein ACCO45_003781 [Purpureocillium lilacinum]|uniref:Uncharacterized protein n=1 Tax=Purpureocillium lilacinum TaxID=33203 RepID=A0ACC4E410_PURLI
MAVNLTGPSNSEGKAARQEIEAKTRLQVDRQKFSCARAGPTPSVALERSVSRRPLSRSNAPAGAFGARPSPGTSPPALSCPADTCTGLRFWRREPSTTATSSSSRGLGIAPKMGKE